MIGSPAKPPSKQSRTSEGLSALAWIKRFFGPAEPVVVKNSRATWILFLVSVLSLFLELMLIRWIGTEVRIFAYLQNTVLVVCFLGLGMGCWTCRRPVARRDLLEPLFILVLILVPICWLSLGTQISLLLNPF